MDYSDEGKSAIFISRSVLSVPGRVPSSVASVLSSGRPAPAAPVGELVQHPNDGVSHY